MDTAENDRIAWEAGAWCDLLMSELAAKSARHTVTARARLFLDAGLPLARVLDALKIAEDEWDARIADHDATKAANRAFHAEREAAATAVPELIA